MKFALSFLLFFSYSLFAEECNDVPPEKMPLSTENYEMVKKLNSEIRADFKRRNENSTGYKRVLSFDTNFKIPLIGRDRYFGRIFFTNNSSEIKYRDELIADRNFDKEKKKPGSVYYTSYSTSEINSPQGMKLVQGAGAEVTLKSEGQFTTTKGGRLVLRVKIPMKKPATFIFDVAVNNGIVQKYIIKDNLRIPFDHFVINAETNMFGTPSILSGIDNLQFYRNGKPVTSISP